MSGWAGYYQRIPSTKEHTMITAIVMMNCEMGKVNEVAEALVNLEGVAEVYSITGDLDIMAVIRVKEYDSLSKLVTEEIADISGVTRTDTHMAFRRYSKAGMEQMWGEGVSS
jgi:DNA-binding Lrp family transcriptional regulator